MSDEVSTQLEAPVKSATGFGSQAKFRQIVVALIALAILVAGGVLNPSQERHFEAISNVIQLRQLDASGSKSAFVISASYNNFFLFSTVTFGDNGYLAGTRLVSYGFFGVVKTTGGIQDVMFAIFKRTDEKEQRK